MCTTAKDTTSCRGHWSQEYLKVARIPNRQTNEDHKLECLSLGKVGRRGRKEIETYFPGSSDLLAGCSSL
jgi:hypothetical protein